MSNNAQAGHTQLKKLEKLVGMWPYNGDWYEVCAGEAVTREALLVSK